MSDGKLTLELEPRVDGDGRKYYIAKIRAPILIDCKDGVAFMIFTAVENEEELQIVSITAPKSNTKQFDKKY